MLRSEENIQRQLSEAISIIGKEDFPEKWTNLLENMVTRVQEACNQYNFAVINGVLQTADSLFKRYEFEYKSTELWAEIKFVLDTFAKPFTELFVWIVKLIPEHFNNAQNIKIIAKSLVYCSKIYYSLNIQDLPEFFEDNIDVWMTNFAELLQMENKILQSDNPDEPGVLEDLKSQICENIGLYEEKYNEEFEKYLGGFIQQVWNLLGSINSDAKYDSLVSNAIRFLSIVAERGLHKEIFEQEQVLQQISSRIIIPSMEFRESDEELFEDNPEEYIRRDVEGADVHTRRRAACDFVKSLAKHFEKPMTDVFSKYIESMLTNFAQNQQQNWKSKNAAIYLVTSLAAKGGSVRLGTTSTSDLINITDFFNNVIRADLERADLNELPVLRADALKYLITFRNQLSVKETWLPIMPQLIRHLSSPVTVIHSYAANCIEKLLTMRSPTNKLLPLVNADEVEPFAQSLILNLLNVFQFPGSAENEFAIKALLRLFSLLRERVLPYFNDLLPKIVEKLTEVAKNPTKPHFNHYIFEVVGLSIKIACTNNPSAVSSFEPLFFPIFTNILVQEVVEFMPYVFQILSLFLEQYQPVQGGSSMTVPEPYMELFSFLLMPPLWEKPPCIAPLVRLLQAYVRNCCPKIISMGKLEPMLGVFQKLIASRMNDHQGFNLLNYLVLFADQSAMSPLLKQIFFLLFQRLTASRTIKYTRSLLIFFSIFTYKYGAQTFYDMIESIQTNMFVMVVEKLFIVDAQKVLGSTDRKTLAVGITKLLTELDVFFTNANLNALWAPLLQALVAVFELPEDESTEGAEHFVEIEEAAGYQASYSQLAHAGRKQLDPMEDIADARIFLATGLGKLSTKYPLKTIVLSMQADAVAFLQKYLLAANVSLM